MSKKRVRNVRASQPDPNGELTRAVSIKIDEKSPERSSAAFAVPDSATAVDRSEAKPIITPRTLLNSLTVEAAVYVLILLFSLLMRFADLGARPLAEHEAASALAAWQFLQGQANGFVGSPLLFSANLFAFFLGAPTDTTPRLAPAFAGSMVVWLPLLARRELGRTGAMIGSLLLLLSTSLTLFARDVSGIEISAAAGLAGLIWAWRYVQGRQSGELYLAAAAWAIALTASSAGYTVLLSGLLAFLIWRFLPDRDSGARSGGDGMVRWAEPKPSENVPVAPIRVGWRNALLLFVAVYAGAATAFLVNREGLGAGFDLLGDWLGQFSHLGPLTTPLGQLVVYEPLILIFGLAGLLLVLGARGGRQGVLTLLAMVTLVALLTYSIAGVKPTGALAVSVIPLALLAGWFLGNLVEHGWEEIKREGGTHGLLWGELPILIVAMMFVALIYLQFVTFLSRNVFSPGVEAFHQLFSLGSSATDFEPAALLLALLSLIIVAFLVLVALGWIGRARTANLAAFTVALILMLASVRALWLANYSPADAVHELLATDQTSLQARDLMGELVWQSEWHANDEHAIAVEADPGLGPVVRWYLRAFPNLKWNLASAAPSAQALVTRADAAAPPGAWMSQNYQIRVDWRLQPTSRADLFRWLIFREGGTETGQSVKLWVPPPPPQQ